MLRELGRLVISRKCYEQVFCDDFDEACRKHAMGKWTGFDDWILNRPILNAGQSYCTSHIDRNGIKFMIVTRFEHGELVTLINLT